MIIYFYIVVCLISKVHHYGPDDTEIQKSIVGFELIGSEYKISKINGW
jgi:hypothetical protein